MFFGVQRHHIHFTQSTTIRLKNREANGKKIAKRPFGWFAYVYMYTVHDATVFSGYISIANRCLKHINGNIVSTQSFLLSSIHHKAQTVPGT